MTKSCSLTIVITASGEMQTHEEATVYVKELDIFLIMKVFENTPALSLGKLCDENGYSCEWVTSQKPHLILKMVFGYCATRRIDLSTDSSSNLPSSTSMALSRQEIDHPTSSSSSSISPTMTSSSVSSKAWIDKNGRDPCGIDHHLAVGSSERVERQERRDP